MPVLPMRVLIADDHSIIRTALIAVMAEIAPDARITEAATLDEITAALDNAEHQDDRFGLAVVDLRMPGHGLSLLDPGSLSSLAGRVSPAPLVVFSMDEDPGLMRSLFAQGIKAYIPKSTDHAQLQGIFRLVLAGGVYVPPALSLGLSSHSMPLPAEATGVDALSLTRRQREVMDLLAQGCSNQEICDALGLNLSTVKAHVSGVLRALGVDSRTQAALRIRQLKGES